MDLEMDYSQDLFNHIKNEIKRLKQQMVENEEREVQDQREKRNSLSLIKRDLKMLKYEKYLAKTISFDPEKIKNIKERIIKLKETQQLVKNYYAFYSQTSFERDQSTYNLHNKFTVLLRDLKLLTEPYESIY
jgi:hypothetical protein